MMPVVTVMLRKDDITTVTVSRAATSAIRPSVIASGTLVYGTQSQLSPEVLGKVTEILVVEGQQVRAGDVVLKLDNHSYQAEVERQQSSLVSRQLEIDRAQLALESSARSLQRTKGLFERGFVSEAALDDASLDHDQKANALASARSAFIQSQAELRQSLDRLSRTLIRAPVSGTVVSIDITVGETTVPSTMGVMGSQLMTIADTGTLMARLNVDESDVGAVALNQEVSLTATAFPTERLVGRVSRVSLVSTNSSNTSGGSRFYAIDVTLGGGSPPGLKSGMSTRAELYVAKVKRAVAVPIQSIRIHATDTGQGGPRAAEAGTVFLAINGRAVERQVTLGTSDDASQEVLSGVSVGDLVIMGPGPALRTLANGSPIAIAPTS
jgi:HlyD family secretion protein